MMCLTKEPCRQSKLQKNLKNTADTNMKFHGLVFLTVLGLADVVAAQSGAAKPDQTFLPPAPRRYDVPSEPTLLPPAPAPIETNAAVSLEAELKQFRNELR